MRINYWPTIVRHYQLESREGDAMKEGKGNTFSTSLNKSFFYSFPRSFALASMCVVSSLLRKSINRNSLDQRRGKGGLTRAAGQFFFFFFVSFCFCARARDRSCNANRRATCNKVENDLVNETQDNE